jgi:hypothetical protein
MTENTLKAYVDECIALLGDAQRLLSMKSACKSSGSKYTVENMSTNFADGVERCLQSAAYRSRGLS